MTNFEQSRLVYKYVLFVAGCDVVEAYVASLDNLATGSVQVAENVMPHLAVGNCFRQRR